jgi:hypothetical protein
LVVGEKQNAFSFASEQSTHYLLVAVGPDGDRFNLARGDFGEGDGIALVSCLVPGHVNNAAATICFLQRSQSIQREREHQLMFNYEWNFQPWQLLLQRFWP